MAFSARRPVASQACTGRSDQTKLSPAQAMNMIRMPAMYGCWRRKSAFASRLVAREANQAMASRSPVALVRLSVDPDSPGIVSK